LSKEIKEYLKTVNAFLAKEHTPEQKAAFVLNMKTRIRFYQHERMIHLIVTALFAILTLLLLISSSAEYFEYLMLAVSFTVLLVPYIFHYYFLENSVQNLYKLYYRLQEGVQGEVQEEKPAVS
jgi:hypothetical protein